MDKIGTVLQTALGAVERGQRGLAASAQAIAAVPAAADPGPLAAPLVAALEQQRALEAAAAVLGHTQRALDALVSALHR